MLNHGGPLFRCSLRTPFQEGVALRHWHKCERWTNRSMECPASSIVHEAIREDDDEEPDFWLPPIPARRAVAAATPGLQAWEIDVQEILRQGAQEQEPVFADSRPPRPDEADNIDTRPRRPRDPERLFEDAPRRRLVEPFEELMEKRFEQLQGIALEEPRIRWRQAPTEDIPPPTEWRRTFAMIEDTLAETVSQAGGGAPHLSYGYRDPGDIASEAGVHSSGLPAGTFWTNWTTIIVELLSGSPQQLLSEPLTEIDPLLYAWGVGEGS